MQLWGLAPGNMGVGLIQCRVTSNSYTLALIGTSILAVSAAAFKESTIVPGNLVFTPRGAIHSFKNIGASIASMLEWTVPGGNEPYFRAVSEMGTNIDPKRLADINAQFATEFIGS